MNNIIFKTLLLKGEAGNSIFKIEKTATDVLVDTYTITLTDGSTTTFEVTNGKSIVSIEKTATSGLVDTYTVTLTNGSTTTFEVTNGADGDDGRGIVSITKTATVGLVDTYTILYTDNTTSTFDVTNSNGGYWTNTVSALVGDTTATITDANILTTSVIDIYAETASGKPLNYESCVVTTGQAVLTFPALEEATSIKLWIRQGVYYGILKSGKRYAKN